MYFIRRPLRGRINPQSLCQFMQWYFFLKEQACFSYVLLFPGHTLYPWHFHPCHSTVSSCLIGWQEPVSLEIIFLHHQAAGQDPMCIFLPDCFELCYPVLGWPKGNPWCYGACFAGEYTALSLPSWCFSHFSVILLKDCSLWCLIALSFNHMYF